MSIQQKQILRRYCSSLYDLSVEKKQVERVTNDLKRLIKLIEESTDLKKLIGSPIVSKDNQLKIMNKLLEKGGFTNLTIKFISVVINNGRSPKLIDIVKEFLNEVSIRKGEINVHVTSVIDLDTDMKNNIKELSFNFTNSKKISLVTKIDKNLIGGVVISIGSKLIDASIKTKLKRLEAEMKGVS